MVCFCLAVWHPPQQLANTLSGLQRDPETYMSNMLVALSQLSGSPDVNLSNVQIVCPMFANGDDKFTAYPWNNSAPSGGYGSYTNVLAWQSNGWINGTYVLVDLVSFDHIGSQY
jgi:hypothetical protein